jgi:predicted amidohydrolase YtcJ
MAQAPETVIVNGRLITFDPQRPRAEALAIAGGLIAAVGTTSEIHALAGPGTRVHDAAAPRCYRASSTAMCTFSAARWN